MARCHVSGLVTSVAQIINQTYMLLEPTWPDTWASSHGGDLRYRVGDYLAFWNREAGTLLSTPYIVQIAPPTSEGYTPVWLSEPPGPIVPGPIGMGRRSNGLGDLTFNNSVTQIFNLNQTANQLVFRRNIFRNGRRAALLAKGYRALVENNFVDGTGGGGVELWPAPYEGLCAAHYVVRNNFFNDTNLLGDRTSAPIWTAAFAHPGTLCHQQILVVNNTIAAGPGSTFLYTDTADVLMQNNTVVRCATDPSPVVSSSNSADIDFAESNVVVNETASWLCEK